MITDSKKQRWIWLLGLLFTLSVAYFNQGIIALDDYSEGFARFIPAQNLDFKETADSAGIRLPFQALVLLALSKLAFKFGLVQPIEQLRFVLMIIGALVFCAHFFSVRAFFREPRERFVALILTSFYFILPLIYSRPLIENMSGAFLSLGAFGAFRFHHENQKRWVVFSVSAVILASLFRFQTGVCILALPLLFLLRKEKAPWGVFFITCFVGFLATGLLDLFLTGGFHRSLRAYVDYNLHHASSYGTTPIYTFLLLFIGLSVPPTFFGRYRDFSWRTKYRPLLPVILFFGVFFIAHSLVPHKEERFMVPVLVLFLSLLTPLARYWLFEAKSTWRVLYFCVLNFSLLALASFSPPQNNVVGLVRYVNDHPQINTVYDFDGSVVLVPSAFSLRKFVVTPFNTKSTPSDLSDCGSVIAVRKDKAEANTEFTQSLIKVAEFKSGPLESLLVRLNPRQNARRGSIYLYTARTCS